MLMTLPLPGHANHMKSDAELSDLLKNASEAAMEMRGVDERERRKYLKQADDACIVLNYRAGRPQDASPPCSSKTMIRQQQARPQPPVQSQAPAQPPIKSRAEDPRLEQIWQLQRELSEEAEKRKTQRKLEIIERIKALIASLPPEEYERAVGSKAL